MKKILISTLISILAISMGNIFDASEISDQSIEQSDLQEVVTIGDEGLDKCLRSSSTVPQNIIPETGDITREDLAEITSIKCYNIDIYDISELAMMPNLKSVSITFSKLGDISPLAGLENLETVNLERNDIIDISALEGKENLNWLDLNHNKIKDVTPIANLTNLRTLRIEYNWIGDISSFNLTELSSINISENSITDISSLANSKNLAYLFADDNDITELSGIGELTSLSRVSMDENQISDISPLNGLPNLKYLSLSKNQISDISCLTDMPQIDDLRLSKNQISDISNLNDLTSVKIILIDDNQISDISAVSDLPNLTDLNIAKNLVSDLSPLNGLPQLERLSAENNQISDLSILEELPKISRFYLDYNQIEDVSNLSNFPNLTVISLGHNNIVDLSTFSVFEDINTLTLNHNKIKHVTPLANLVTLKKLALESNQITDISTLSNLEEANITAWGQRVYLEPIEVEKADEIVYKVVDIDGTIIPVPTGELELGVNNVTVPWTNNNEGAILFDGVGFQEIIYITYFTGKDVAETNQGTKLSDEELINLFDVHSSFDRQVTVGENNVNFDIAGQYNVTFIDEEGKKFNSILNVIDILPTITTDKNDVYITEGSNIDNVLEQLNVVATEIIEGDLTSTIIYDDSSIDYNQPGEYQLAASVTDIDGNEVSASINVHVTAIPITISGDSAASINQGSFLSSQDLIDLFNVAVNSDEIINVDFTQVNFEVPGDYPVVFTTSDSVQLDAVLTINDLLPQLNVDKDAIEVSVGSELNDITSKLNIVATEITEGDLTSSITFDDSQVNYSVSGKYNFMIFVSDREGNQAQASVIVSVVDSELIETEESEAIDNEKSEIKVEIEDNSTSQSNEQTVVSKLGETGRNIVLVIMGLTVLVVALVQLKKVVKKF